MDNSARESQKHLEKDETSSLISANKVEGTEIYNRNGEHLGEVGDVMIDKITGKVAYAVVEFGGFLGMGEKRRALPWSVLTYDNKQEGYVIDADKDVLQSTPEYSSSADFSNREWGTRIHQHFGVPPYWSR